MTTIIWNHGRLVADTRVVFFDGPSEQDPIKAVSDNYVKIFTPEALVVNGEKILAVGSSGDQQLNEHLRRRDLVGGDMVDGMFYADVADKLLTASAIIAIGLEHNYLISIKAGVLTWTQFAYNVPLAIGTGVEFINDIFTKLPPEITLARAMERDKMTGGRASIWAYEKREVKTITLKTKRLFSMQRWVWLLNPLLRLAAGENRAQMQVTLRPKPEAAWLDDERVVIDGKVWKTPI